MKKTHYITAIPFSLALFFVTPLVTAYQVSLSLSDLRNNGAFGFPQQYAIVLCDRLDLKVSVCNNDEWLYVQAIIWQDGDDSLGKTDDGREIGDYSSLMFSFSNGSKRVAKKDRNYYLNPWPGIKGLRYTIILSENSSTALKDDSKGLGAIRYVSTSEGNRLRIDSYLVPLTEIGRKAGERIKLCYYGSSPLPEFTIHSSGSKSVHLYFNHQVPVRAYNELDLQKGNTFQFDKFQ